MKKHFLKSFALLAMLFSAISINAGSAWCNRVIGHLDPNGVGDKDDKSYVRLTVQDNQDGTISFIVAADPTLSKAAPDVDYVLINPGIGTAGDDATALESQTVKYSVPAGTEKITVEILWSYSNWGGRYMVQNLEIPLSEICGERDSGEGGEDPVEPTPEPEPEPETPSIVYCDFPTGHNGDANFGDANGRILVSLVKKSETEVRLVVKSAEVATKNLDLLYVEAAGANPHATTVGSDVAESDLREMSVDITYPSAPAKYSFMIQWSHPDWVGRWQTNLNDITVEQLCTEGGGEGGEEPEPTPDPDPEETIITYTYFAPNWTVDPTSSATYDANTGAITVDLKSQFNSQWQAQVKVKHDVAFSADKQYTLSCKFHATAAVNGVTIKMDDNQDAPVLLENASVTLPANQDYVYTSVPNNGVAGNNQILVFDFGWAPACQITISDIVIQEVEPTQPEEPETPSVVYCDFPTGHNGDANFGDANGRILVSLIKKSETSVRLVVKSADAATKNLDLLYVEAAGANPGAITEGSDVAEGDLREMSVDITYPTAPAKYTFMIQWSHPAWDGRWQTNLNDITPEQLCTEGGAEGGTPTEVYDTNFALTANGATAEATSGDPVQALDNNTGTRWESAAADPQTFIIDLGQERIFNTLEIVWEGAYAKTFTVSTSSDKIAWTPVWNVTGQELAGFPYTQTQVIDKTTARYVKFEGIERGTPYGYSFWEFRVYLAGVSTLTSLEAKAESAITKVGATNTITITPKDQNGQAMADAGEVIYTITPADAGTITGNVYTPAKIGAASIVASIGEVAAAAFEVVAYDGENLAFSADRINANKVIAQSGLVDGSSFDAWYAVDGNDGSVWQGSLTNGTAGDEAARTFDSWFVLDFGAYYDINLVSIKFEGACSQDYHIDFSADNATWNVAYNHVGNAGVNAHTKYIYGGDLQNTTKVRYARFYSTKAATEWGVKLFEFQVYGLPFVASGDTEKPVMGTATLVSKNHNSAIITVTATDNDEVAAYHIVDNTNSYEQTLAPTDGKITLVGLNPETAYALTITALDLAGNESENAATVSFTTDVYNLKPTSAPAAPTHEANKVQSVFCDVYGGTFSAIEGWGQSTQFEELNFNGNYVRYYTNFNYLGWQTATPINAFAMEKLHLDIWASDNATLDIVPIYGGPGLQTDDQQVKKVTLVGQQWNSIEFDLATDFPNLNISSIFQFKFFNPSGAAIFAFDNVYFYRESETGDVTPPTNLTATAVPSFTTAVINCKATDESGNITYKVYLGTEFKGSGSANSGETAAITVTNLQPNSEFTMTVIATDAYGNESDETVDVTFTTLSYPAPAPAPKYPEANVFSVYSNAYTTTVNRAFGWGWGASTEEAEVQLAAGDNALQYTTCDYAGWEFNGNTSIGDLNEYPYLHMDIYVENAGYIQFSPIWGAEALKTYTLKAGWNAIDIDLVAEFKGINLANIIQMKWAAMPATCFIDNVYFYKPIVVAENTDPATLPNGFVCDVEFAREMTVADGIWNTIALPFSMTKQQINETFGSATRVAKLQTTSTVASQNEIKLIFDFVNVIEAGVPYIILPEETGKDVVIRGVTINTTPSPVVVPGQVTMHPVLKTISYNYSNGDPIKFFLSPDGNLHYNESTNSIKALRAYFTFDNVTSVAAAANVRARIALREDATTGLDNLINENAPVKVIENGQLIIIRDGVKYNVQGQVIR